MELQKLESISKLVIARPVNAVHFESILRAMRDNDETAFDMAMITCIPDFMEGCDDCED